jgi:cyclic pyranopterin phosphate synthase
MNDGYIPSEERLDVRAWKTVLESLVRDGVTRVRITGGEPLLFKDLLDVVAMIRALGVEDLALTTNASRLKHLAKPLRAAGLQRVNISLDSLRPERFAELTRGGDLSVVLQGIDAALSAGFDEVKTNTVVLAGRNDDELCELVQWAWERSITPRFLEVMGIGEGSKLFRSQGVGYAQMRALLEPLLEPQVATRDAQRGPARYVYGRRGSANAHNRVGFITGTTDTYCAGCDRLRVSSDGVLRACLARNEGVDVSDAARVGAHEGVSAGLKTAWEQKPDASWKGCTELSAAEVSMRGIGG